MFNEKNDKITQCLVKYLLYTYCDVIIGFYSQNNI